MYHLTKRQESILYYVLQAKEIINIKKLAKKYQLSERSIHYDLDYVNAWLKERGGFLRNNRTGGILFEGSRECREMVLDQLFQQDIQSKVLTKAERVEYIFDRLLLADRVITSEDLIEELQVSRPTVLNDLKEVEEKAKERYLLLHSKKGAGYWMEGREIVYRTQIVQMIIKILMNHKIQNYDSLYLEINKTDAPQPDTDYQMVLAYIKEIDVLPVFDMLNIFRKENNIQVSDADSFELFISLIVMVKRLLAGHTVRKENITNIERKQETKRYILARGICEQLEDDYEVICSKTEITFVILKLIECNVAFADSREEQQVEELSATAELMLQVIRDYEIVYIDDAQMEDLKNDLYEYLNLLIRKRRLDIGTPNPLLVQTKAGYPQIFKEAVRMAEIFELREGITMTEEEIGTIAIFIAAYADNPEQEYTKTTLIVCNEGKGLSKVLYNRIKNNIPNLSIKAIVSVNELNQNRDTLQGIDFVISTVELNDLEIPVFCVSPIISVFDIRYISDYISGHASIKVVNAAQMQGNPMNDIVVGILMKYLDSSKLELIKEELNYAMIASTGFVSEENTHLIQEEYAYRVSMVIVKLTDMFTQIKKQTGRSFDIETMMGLVIHIAMSVSRWEKKEFLQEKRLVTEGDEMKHIYNIVETFIHEVSDIFHYTIDKGEAVAIIRYLM